MHTYNTATVVIYTLMVIACAGLAGMIIGNWHGMLKTYEERKKYCHKHHMIRHSCSEYPYGDVNPPND